VVKDMARQNERTKPHILGAWKWFHLCPSCGGALQGKSPSFDWGASGSKRSRWAHRDA